MMDIKKIPPQVVPYMESIPAIMRGALSRVAGNYYGMLGSGQATSTATVAKDKIYAIPFLVLKEETFNGIAIYVNTGSEGNARLGIYADNGQKPEALVLDAGTVNTSTSGVKAIAINQALSPGLYWLVALFSSTPSVSVCAYHISLLGIGNVSLAHNGNVTFYYSTQTYGELPATHPAVDVTTAAPIAIMLKRA